MKQTKEHRKAYISARAVEMAQSGKYRDWEQIEFALCFDEGFIEARGWLDSRPRRDWLNRLCREAKEAKPTLRSPKDKERHARRRSVSHPDCCLLRSRDKAAHCLVGTEACALVALLVARAARPGSMGETGHCSMGVIASFSSQKIRFQFSV
jgi:hypothetical protein